MWKSIANFIIRRRSFILIVLLVLTAFLGYRASFVKMEYEYAKMLPDKDSISIQYENFKKMFGEDSNTMVLGFQDSSFFQKDKINDWQLLCDSIKSIDGVLNLLSIGQIYDIKKNKAKRKFELIRILPKVVASQAELDQLHQSIKRLPFYKKLLYNDSSKVYLAAITISKDIVNSKNRVPLIDSIERIVENYARKYNLEFHYSGLPYTRTKIAEMVKSELIMFIFLAMIVTAVILLLLFRSFKVVAFSILVVGTGVIWAVGSLNLFGYDITILTGMIPPLLIVIGIPNCVFLLNKYHNLYVKTGNKIESLKIAIRKMGSAIFLTNLTTASGFATFIVTKNRILAEFGIVASLNIMSVFVLSLTLIPIFFSYLSPPNRRHIKHLDSQVIRFIINKLIVIASYHQKKLYAFIIVFVVLAIFGITKMKSTGYIVDDIPKDNPVFVDLKFFEEHFDGVMPLEISIDTRKRKAGMQLSTFKKIERLQKKLVKYKEISTPISLGNGIKFARQAYFNGNEKQYKIPKSSEAGFILSYLKKDKDKSNLLNTYIDSLGRHIRISLRVKDVGTIRMKRLKEEIKAEIDSVFSPEKYTSVVTGSSIVFTQGITHLIRNLFTSLVLAITLISIFMAFMFSSGRMILVSLTPNIIPLMFTAAIMGYFDIAIKPSTVLVFSIAFGISVDNAIHFLAKYRQELKTSNWNIREAVITALQETGVSIIYTASILFFGFGIFILSDFGGTVALGLLVSITLLVAMLANLLLLPSLLLSLEKSLTTSAFREPFLKFFSQEIDLELDELKIAEIEIKQSEKH